MGSWILSCNYSTYLDVRNYYKMVTLISTENDFFATDLVFESMDSRTESSNVEKNWSISVCAIWKHITWLNIYTNLIEN